MRQKKNGITHVQLTLSNTIITIIDFKGNKKNWSPSSSLGFKGFHCSTNYAAQATIKNNCEL
jgi:ribosomal protein S11